MIIDIHGHYTTVPASFVEYRAGQISTMASPTKGSVKVSDDEILPTKDGSRWRTGS